MPLASMLQPATARSGEPGKSPRTEEMDLLGRSQAGDVAAFNQMVERYQGCVYELCFHMLGGVNVDDVTQEVFITAFRRIQRYRRGTFIAWLLRIATNECFARLRVRFRTPVIPPQPSDSTEAPDGRLLRPELARIVRRGLQELEAEQRLIVILRDLQEYRYDDIVAVTGWPLHRVKFLLRSGRARLQTALRTTNVRDAW